MSARGSKGSRLAAAGLTLTTLLVLLAALEVGLRLTGHGPSPLPSPFSGEGALGGEASGALPDDELFYRLKPGTRFLDYYRINALGCRGPELPAGRAPGTLRIVCTGDSSTFGLGVPEERAWPFVLQRLMEAMVGDLVDVEVLDAGVPGYTSLQNRVQIERDLLPLRPDVLVWMPTGHNDNAHVTGRDDAAALEYRRGWRFRLSRWALPRALGLAADAATPADTGAAQDALAAGTHGRPRVPLDAFEANLRAVIAACAGAHVPLLLIVPPHSDLVRAQRPEEAGAEDILLRVAGELHVPVTDPRPDLAALAPRPLFPDTVHPNADGQAVLGWSAFEGLAVHPEAFAWPGRRGGFAAGWVASHSGGVSMEDPDDPVQGSETPPRFRQALQSLLSGTRDEPADVLAYDPVNGEKRGPYGLGRELLLASQGDPSAADAETLALLSENIAPHDDLALLLFDGPQDPATPADSHAVALARAISAFDALLGAHPAPGDRRLWEAQRLCDGGDPQGAIALVEQVLALNPRCADAFAVRGLALEKMGDKSGAQEAFALGAQLEPDSATGLFLLGRTQLQHGEFEAAAASLRRALLIDPAHKLARLALVLTLLRQHLPDEAEQQLHALQRVGASDVVDVPAMQAAIDAERKAAPGP
ncbi:MAG TPA: GDSL-type esterase/lipase family protein [Planctomycetota bacterium]|nr:GDSL-type esterase/lipase family protein [Planctomycetota bacterium]